MLWRAKIPPGQAIYPFKRVVEGLRVALAAWSNTAGPASGSRSPTPA
jgi:hypothetical protein